jgi:stearoyl-CoA desaturase (delta-9 desaturase)
MTLLDDVTPSATPPRVDDAENGPELDLGAATGSRGGKPMLSGRKGFIEIAMLYVYVVAPFAAVIGAIAFSWGWGMTWLDALLLVTFYFATGWGVTIGFHRYLTHGSFKATTPLRVVLAVAGSLAIEGPVIRWVGDHRRHHAYSDKDGDPHSPWRYGESIGALSKGLWWAHMGWMFDVEKTNLERYAPDLLADKAIKRVNILFPVIAGISTFLPALIGFLVTGTWHGTVEAFFWGSLVRIALLHHVTWSINSICHTLGERPYFSRDKSTNFWPLAILSFGESWHNSHHADPTCARHGVRRGQIDSSARIIWAFERFGWVSNVRWPKAERFAKLEAEAREQRLGGDPA